MLSFGHWHNPDSPRGYRSSSLRPADTLQMESKIKDKGPFRMLINFNQKNVPEFLTTTNLRLDGPGGRLKEGAIL